MVSTDLAAKKPQWRIRHPFINPGLSDIPDLSETLLLASDHYPVTIDLPDVI